MKFIENCLKFQKLKTNLLKVIGSALKDLAPAKLSFGKGSAPFAMNRRELRNGKIVNGVNREGVVDKEVPVLKIESADGKLRDIAFGYACHNTTLTGEFYQLSGDYAGFAQLAIEKNHPGALALFITGCGADINPYPRSKLEYAQAYGDDLCHRRQTSFGWPDESYFAPTEIHHRHGENCARSTAEQRRMASSAERQQRFCSALLFLQLTAGLKLQILPLSWALKTM